MEVEAQFAEAAQVVGAVLVDRAGIAVRGGLDGLTEEELNSFVRFANKAASITTSRRGAIPAMPTLKEVQEALS